MPFCVAVSFHKQKNAPAAGHAGLQGRKVEQTLRGTTLVRRSLAAIALDKYSRSHQNVPTDATIAPLRSNDCTMQVFAVPVGRFIPRRCNGRPGPSWTVPIPLTDRRQDAFSNTTARCSGSVQRIAPRPSSAAPPTPAFTIPGSLQSVDVRLLLPIIAFSILSIASDFSRRPRACQLIDRTLIGSQMSAPGLAYI